MVVFSEKPKSLCEMILRTHKIPFHLHLLYLIRQLFRREHTFVGRQRMMVLLSASLMAFLGVAANLFKLNLQEEPFFLILHYVYLPLTLGAVLLYFLRAVKVKTAIIMLTLFAQICSTTEILFCSFAPTQYDKLLIAADIFLSIVNILFALMAYLRYLPYVLSLMTLSAFTFGVYYNDSSEAFSFLPLYVLSFTAVSTMGHWLVKNTRDLDHENIRLRQEESLFRRILHLHRSEVNAYLELAERPHEKGETARLFNLMSEKTQQHVVSNLKAYLIDQEMQRKNIAALLPELTPSECEICQLILKGKKLGEICSLLNKSETNICSQRAHIRKKLGLQTKDDLREALRQRVQQQTTSK